MTGGDRVLLTGRDVDGEGLADWRPLFAELRARFRTADFASALELVNRIGAVAEEADHHPDLGLAWGRVDVRLSSHDVGGLTQRDVRLARVISTVAAEVGATAVTDGLATVELALDTPDLAAVRPFWAAVLGYELGSDPVEIVDPTGTHPTIWFQESTDDGEVPQRWHLDVRVPPEVAGERIGAALAAGGTLVGDDRAPAVVVLADAQGNKACVTTWQGRD
ncbi:4a-hydroxytetrahydrobiopterin dehydratase [Pseudonocardia sp. KRD-184]|uniref:4a-hydroxytetrahydrobiopterin dehydratase n=1 Tax=Pseudonocardia oceani TaxID=2792013 RepID=A0ABS6U5V3_9PSEU|nr:4a-hydroxytetrahydrobiopterin dehydratase [Pseudonocardia oceani]MBW0092360.1 4a-hydroxytetrahydrobiopterin dehydratase [Pseudonocardia oceani]MBW0097595.1 4a-hydroxytetrahydrobiopterin dehydratase [Pseudonocardia oceani]MBW0110275.1 4a-hydroxytetrahydrobiopterin dehydratase [Pseudonocardia oceani]MBW0124301.1 4a-hydroxytetrahydrobiopterin dehydratase [Pseudonocardia oceani]MBW0127597.1 4a-hydroxytetrahydrobiopterin dehydratase [Pseudonocardia oceani]